jgi:hypothetical protein
MANAPNCYVCVMCRECPKKTASIKQDEWQSLYVLARSCQFYKTTWGSLDEEVANMFWEALDIGLSPILWARAIFFANR